MNILSINKSDFLRSMQESFKIYEIKGRARVLPLPPYKNNFTVYLGTEELNAIEYAIKKNTVGITAMVTIASDIKSRKEFFRVTVYFPESTNLFEIFKMGIEYNAFMCADEDDL